MTVTRSSRAPRRAIEVAELDGGGPLERLSRLGAGSAYKEPTLGRTRRSLSVGAEDLAHALSFVEDPLSQCLALALACQTIAEWSKVQELAVPRILADLRNSQEMRSLVAGHLALRVRLVLHEAFHDLALLRPDRTWKQAAASVRMNETAYRLLYTWIAGYIETIAGAGAREAVRALSGHPGK